MKLILHIIDEPEGEEIIQRSICLPDNGGTIGRAADCQVQLPDSQHRLSRHHAAVSRSGEGYLIMDTSTNGLYLNDSGRALGRGNRIQLQDGDVIRIPGYTLVVSCFNPAHLKKQGMRQNQEP
ncbi:type VI secretion system-associated FHA domain protein [Spongorhabdus nitratireducens]